ncbi:hypothetical protein [Nocardia takedensis]|uniref:hypothetical protein n=1 Tax=Nocardia takedensis TaxID=259390 RepID=UPI0003159869|nr:hypothetical protein [Nocardia takedensis]
MSYPNNSQIRVLEALSHHHLRATDFRESIDDLEGPPPDYWQRAHRRHLDAATDLTEFALAAGIPRTWIDEVAADAQKRNFWVPGFPLPHGRTDYDRVLTDLTSDVTRIQDFEALDAAARRLRAPDPHPTQLRATLDVLWRRTTGVANVLELTDRQGRMMWGQAADWARYGVDALHEASPEQILDRWAQAATTDVAALSRQTVVLATDAAIGVDLTTALPLPDRVRAAIETELDRAGSPVRGPSPTLDSAVQTALAGRGDTALFSHPEAEAAWLDTSDRAAAPAEFSSRDNGVEG